MRDAGLRLYQARTGDTWLRQPHETTHGPNRYTDAHSVGVSVQVYGDIKPVPSHDGTECLKFDDTLWSHADHFKVRTHHPLSLRILVEDLRAA